jgi:hypothetical protein
LSTLCAQPHAASNPESSKRKHRRRDRRDPNEVDAATLKLIETLDEKRGVDALMCRAHRSTFSAAFH